MTLLAPEPSTPTSCYVTCGSLPIVQATFIWVLYYAKTPQPIAREVARSQNTKAGLPVFKRRPEKSPLRLSIPPQ